MANFNDGDIKFEADLQDFFGFPRGTGIGYMITHAGADGRINKWAFCKPFINASGAFAETSGDKGVANRNRARRGSYGTGAGLTAPHGTNGYEGVWEYNRPNGTIGSQPFRSFDFLGYNHDATLPLSITWQNSKIEYTQAAGVNTFGVNITVRKQDNINVSVGDLFDERKNTLYFCLVIKIDNNYTYVKRLTGGYGTSELTIGDIMNYGGGGCTFDTSILYNQLLGKASVKCYVVVGTAATGLYNGNVSWGTDEPYSLCCTAGLASATMQVVQQTSTWYQGLHAKNGSSENTCAVSGEISGNTAHIKATNGITTTLSKDSGSALTAYYRVYLIPASASSITVGSQTYNAPILLPASASQTATFTTTATTFSVPSSIFSNYTWHYAPGAYKVIAVSLFFYRSLSDAQNDTDRFGIAGQWTQG